MLQLYFLLMFRPIATISIPFSSKAFIAPICAAPLIPPPASAKPIFIYLTPPNNIQIICRIVEFGEKGDRPLFPHLVYFLLVSILYTIFPIVLSGTILLKNLIILLFAPGKIIYFPSNILSIA